MLCKKNKKTKRNKNNEDTGQHSQLYLVLEIETQTIISDLRLIANIASTSETFYRHLVPATKENVVCSGLQITFQILLIVKEVIFKKTNYSQNSQKLR